MEEELPQLLWSPSMQQQSKETEVLPNTDFSVLFSLHNMTKVDRTHLLN